MKVNLRKLLICFFSLFSTLVVAQSNEYVVGSVAGELNLGVYSFEFSMGEVEIALRTDGNTNITGGFLQPDFVSIGIGESENNAGHIEVYPNPTQNFIHFNADKADNFRVSICSINGKILNEIEISGFGGAIDLSPFVPGFYLLNIRSINGTFDARFKILKL